MLYCASSNPRLPFIHVLVYRSLTVAAPNRGRERNVVRRRKRLRHPRQVVCLQRWGRRFRLPIPVAGNSFTASYGRGSDVKSCSFNHAIGAPTVREGLLRRRTAVSRQKLISSQTPNLYPACFQHLFA